MVKRVGRGSGDGEDRKIELSPERHTDREGKKGDSVIQTDRKIEIKRE